MALDELRDELDQIDSDIIELFEKRMVIARRIGGYKKLKDLPIRDRERENAILKRLESKVSEEVKFGVEPLYEKIFQLSKEYQMEVMNNSSYNPENYYGLIGEKLSHSKSAKIHKLIGGYDYEMYPMDSYELENFLRIREFSSMNVTIPYKVEAIKYIDEMSSLAKEIGSINTIVNKKGKLFGYNTDYYGFKYMCDKAGISLRDKNVLIFGTGGASKTIETLVRDEKAKSIVLISRRGENNYNNLEKFKNYDVIINTTPVGMYPNNLECKIDLGIFENCQAVIDIIYNPLKTKLILNAERRGIKTATGLDMLVSQAYYASQLFLDKDLPIESVESTIKKIKQEMLNIVLVGMPGSGKSTIGKMLAKKLNKKLVDLDQLIEETTGMSISDIFKEKGEGEFRNIESELIKNVGKENGLIIATGGGTPIYQENSNALSQNSYIIFLDRDVNKLERKGRPLSKDIQSLEMLYKDRYNIYKSIASKEIKVLEDMDKTLELVIEGLIEDEIISD